MQSPLGSPETLTLTQQSSGEFSEPPTLGLQVFKYCLLWGLKLLKKEDLLWANGSHGARSQSYFQTDGAVHPAIPANSVKGTWSSCTPWPQPHMSQGPFKARLKRSFKARSLAFLYRSLQWCLRGLASFYSGYGFLSGTFLQRKSGSFNGVWGSGLRIRKNISTAP